MKWRLWHGRVDRAIRDLEGLLARLKPLQQEGVFSLARLHSLGSQLLIYIRSNRGPIVNYGQRYRAGLRVATILAESAVNSLVGKRMVKKQQMRWTLHGAHMLRPRSMVSFAIFCGHRSDSRGRTYLPCSTPNRRSCAPLSPRQVTGLKKDTAAFLRSSAKRHPHQR